MMDIVRPRLKSFTRVIAYGHVSLIRETGVQVHLPDPDGQVLALLELLDGSRTIEAIARDLAPQWPELTVEGVAEGIMTLDDAGLLEDAAAQTTLCAEQQERYFSNLAFFGTFASLSHSCYAY